MSDEAPGIIAWPLAIAWLAILATGSFAALVWAVAHPRKDGSHG